MKYPAYCQGATTGGYLPVGIFALFAGFAGVTHQGLSLGWLSSVFAGHYMLITIIIELDRLFVQRG